MLTRRKWGRLARALALACLLAQAPSLVGRAEERPRGAAPPAKNAALAINLSGLAYWLHEWTFLDLVKRAKDWGGTPGTTYRVDKDGWINWLAPGQRGVAQIGAPDATFPRNFPIGRYVALWEGKGHVVVECARCRDVQRAAGRLVVDVGESSYVRIAIDAIDPVKYIRNLRVVPIEHEATHLTQPFHPRFLDGLRPFAGIRFMGNQNTNGNPQVRWSDRTTATSAFQDAPAGMALEHMIQLANLAGADPWFCVPVRADDDYVRNFARMVLTRLDRRRKVYIEYGNEIWNQSFPYIVDGAWMTAEARRIGLPLGPGDDGSDMIYRLRYQVLRSRQIFESFQREMDALGIDRRRLVRVIASQAGYFDRIEQTLDYRFPDGSRAYQHADALGVAPYFAPFASPEQSDLAENRWSADQILDFAECAASLPERAPAFCARIPHDPVAPMMRRDAEIARRRGLRLLGYEGGQHMLAGNGHLPFAEKLKAVNRAPRMKAIYARYLETWRACGGELMFLVNYVQPYGLGYWGMLERQDQPIGEAPKMSAAVEFASRQAPWWKDPWP